MRASPGLRTVVALIALVLLASACSTSATGASPGDGSPRTTVASPRAVPTATANATPSATRAAFHVGGFPRVPTEPLPPATAAALQAVLDGEVRAGLPGVTASVLVADRGAWSGAAGTSDGVNPMPVTARFGIASITKTIIASEIMWLAEQGKLRLDDEATRYLPDDLAFDTNGATIRDLLAMRGGMPDPALIDDPELVADPLREWTPREILASVPGDRAPAGADFRYSNTNYIVLGLVVEHVTGMSVAKALRAHVLADPSLATLVYQPEERPEAPLALPFIGPAVREDILERGGGYLATKADASALGSAGGMASDAATLARFAYVLWGGQLVSDASLDAMTDFGTGEAYPGYGLGVFDLTDRSRTSPVPAIGNGGQDSAGYASVMVTLPSEGTVIVVLINQDVDPQLRAIPVVRALADALSR